MLLIFIIFWLLWYNKSAQCQGRGSVMAKVMSKRFVTIIGSLFLCLSLAMVYNRHINRSFLIAVQDVTVENLPAAFDGFKILQISDLHGSYFADGQADLIQAIHQTEYDILVLTGDMNQKEESSLANSKAVLDLINGIENKKPILWVDGNKGPYAMETVNGHPDGNLTAFGKILQGKGCKVLIFPYEILRGSDSIWFIPDVSNVRPTHSSQIFHANLVLNRVSDQNMLSYHESQREAFQQISTGSETKILLTHLPKVDGFNVKTVAGIKTLVYDLIIAGHYHGGQIRVPFWGALFIPTQTPDFLDKLFPDQADVKGLSVANGVPQYISAGLGASSAAPFLAFRFFNPPEINLITLRSRAAKQ